MKKIFAQPEMTVVNMKSNIIATSNPKWGGETDKTNGNLAPGMRGLDDYYEGY
ncbi:MAG: hypothetical protein IJS49_01625 [Paludibacteraceae bacterium]|nr:hypothetical protein [Paludibacteraceae bacterium]